MLGKWMMRNECFLINNKKYLTLKGNVYRYSCYFTLCVNMIIDSVLGNDSSNLVWIFTTDHATEHVQHEDFAILSRTL